jgi:CRISPR-associated protein Csd1
MILQALHRLYERRANASDPAERPAPLGFEEKEIPFVIEIDRAGRLIQIRDTRRSEGKKKIARAELVPQGVKKTSGVAANLLWDPAEYVLGIDVEVKGKVSKPERVHEQHAAFCSRIQALPEAVLQDPGVAAVVAFLGAIDMDALTRVAVWEEISTTNPLLSFRLQGDAELVCQRSAVRQAWLDSASNDVPDGTCLITGGIATIERLHSAIKGVWGAQSSGANIVSFNLDAFGSYGKQQGANAPIGKNAAAMYTTALNDLLARDSRQRIQVGDASTVFWSDEKNALEDDFALLFGEPGKNDPARDVDRLKALYQSIISGKYAQDAGAATRFYVLGLAPNAARISVRFWHVDTVVGCSDKIARYFSDIALVHAPHEPDTPSLFRLLASCAAQGKADNIPPSLSGDVMRAILEGLPYPQSWLQAALRRCRAEQDVGYLRAAIIKACLNRLTRSRPTGEKELTVSLDENNPNVAYRLGRLFAALEKIQEEASPGLNATIRERYYGAACSAPVTVFSTLMRLKNHHLAKLDSRGRATHFERLIGEIVGGIADFPAQLALADQGRFAIGYYHQRQAFYTKADKTNDNKIDENQGEIA